MPTVCHYLPVAFELIRQPIRYGEVKARREKRKREVTKNEQLRERVDTGVRHQLKFAGVLADIWFASTANRIHIQQNRHKDFIMAMKSNRLLALSETDRKKKRYTRLDQLNGPEAGVVTGWLKDGPFPVRLARQGFTNKDGRTGTRYLACSQRDVSWETMTTVYQKRWPVEVFHKSLKSNAGFTKSPAHTPKTQANHLVASIVAVFKREKLEMSTQLNHFALKSKLYLKAIRNAFEELQAMKTA